MRIAGWALWLAFVAGSACAQATEHASGGFSFAVAPVPAYVIEREVPSIWDEAAPGAKESKWRYWLYDIQADRRRGHDITYVDYAYEAKSTSLLGEAGRFQIRFNPEYQKLAIHKVRVRRAGIWMERLDPADISLARRENDFEQDMTNGEVTALIVLGDLRVDDVVRISYSIAGSNPILAGQTSDWMNFEWRNPVLDAWLRVIDDREARLLVHHENGITASEQKTLPDGVELAMHAHGSAPVVDEGDYPPWYQPFRIAQVAPARTWADVVAWALPLYPEAGPLPPDLEERLAGWSRRSDPHARLAGALRAVQDEVRYFGVEIGDNSHRPAAPTETWNRRFGDCKDKAYLLATLLQRMGMDAVPALVSTSRGKAVKDFVPSASVFNHMVVRVVVDGSTLWVDPTIPQQGGDPRASDLSRYGFALPIVQGTEGLQWIDPPASSEQGIVAIERFSPAPGGTRLRIRTTYRGRAADKTRYSLANARREDFSRRYADYYRQRYGDLTVGSLPQVEDDRAANVLSVTEDYILKDPFMHEGGPVMALDVYGEALQAASALPSTMSRRGPLEFAYSPGSYRHEIEVELPDGWHTRVGNEHTIYGNSPAFDYSRDLEVDGESIRLVYSIKVKQGVVMPDGVATHLAELRKVRDNLSARLRMQVPAGMDVQERDRRLKALLRDVVAEGSQP